jgi:hypothetical protein
MSMFVVKSIVIQMKGQSRDLSIGGGPFSFPPNISSITDILEWTRLKKTHPRKVSNTLN